MALRRNLTLALCLTVCFTIEVSRWSVLNQRSTRSFQIEEIIWKFIFAISVGVRVQVEETAWDDNYEIHEVTILSFDLRFCQNDRHGRSSWRVWRRRASSSGQRLPARGRRGWLLRRQQKWRLQLRCILI